MSDELPVSKEEIGQALADSLGLESKDQPPSREIDEFFASVQKESTKNLPPDQPSEGNISGAKQKFVHEPTGKEFDTETEYLKYNNGYDVQRLGEKAKALEIQLAELKGQVAAGQQPIKQPSKKDLKRVLWPDASEDVLNDPASDFVLQGVENAVGILTQQSLAELQKRDALIEKLMSRLDETDAYSNSGVDRSVEQRLAQKYAAQKAKLSPSEWVAMVKDFAGAPPANADTGRLLDRISGGRNPADHVEGSALSEPQSSEAALFEEFDKLNDPKKELSILGRLVAQNREFGGYEPTSY